MEKVRFGFIGAGSIAKSALYPALINSSVGEIYAVAGKDGNRAKSLSPSGKFYTDYQKLKPFIFLYLIRYIFLGRLRLCKLESMFCVKNQLP
jgi:hypothetical protein